MSIVTILMKIEFSNKLYAKSLSSILVIKKHNYPLKIHILRTILN